MKTSIKDCSYFVWDMLVAISVPIIFAMFGVLVGYLLGDSSSLEVSDFPEGNFILEVIKTSKKQQHGFFVVFLFSEIIFLSFWFSILRAKFWEKSENDNIYLFVGIALLLCINAVFLYLLKIIEDNWRVLIVFEMCLLPLWVFIGVVFIRGGRVKEKQLRPILSIFLPGIVISSTSISFGLFLSQKWQLENTSFQGDDSVFNIIAISLLACSFVLFRVAKKPLAGIFSYWPMITLSLVVVISIVVGLEFTKLLPSLIALTFSSAVLIASQQVNLFSKKGLTTIREDKYYLCSSNWISIIFPFLLIILFAIFNNTRDLVVLPVVGFMLIWLYISDHKKKSNYGFYLSTFFGLLVPLCLIISFTGSLGTIPEIQDDRLTSVTLGLFAMFAYCSGMMRFTKDLCGFPLDKFYYNMWNSEIYEYGISSFFLLLMLSSAFSGFIALVWVLILSSPIEITRYVTNNLGSTGVIGSKVLGASITCSIICTISFLSLFFKKTKVDTHIKRGVKYLKNEMN